MNADLRKDPGIQAIRGLRWLILTVIWAGVTVMLFPILVYTLPDLEAAWAPPIAEQRISDVHKDDGSPEYLKWKWSFVKKRTAVPEYITFMAYSNERPRVRYNVDTYIGWDCVNNLQSDRTSPPGPDRIERKMCVKLPKALQNAKDVRVDGVFDFRVGHDFYTVPVKVPDEGDWPQLTAGQSIPEPIANPR